jgi:hypothetical protein
MSGYQYFYNTDIILQMSYVYEAKGNSIKAINLQNNSIKIIKNILGINHVHYLFILSKIGYLYEKIGLIRKALQIYRYIF